MQPLPDMNEVMKLAASPAGKKLLSILQNDPSIDLKKLMQSASSGNFAEAKQQLSGFLASDETHSLLKQLEKDYE